MHKHGGHGNAFCAKASVCTRGNRGPHKVRGSITHTCFKSHIILGFERRENIAIHLYSSIMSAAVMLALEGVACPLYLHMRISYGNKLKPRNS